MTSSLLQPLASLYGGAVRLRASLFDRGWLRSESVAAPVLSVGNLVAGGTGKTPVTLLVARILVEAGMRPAIVSRGYGGRRAEDPLVVSDGNAVNPEATAEKAGDEPAMLARLLSGVPVVVARRRVEGARLAISRLGAGSIVLDDGYQHFALRRDFDLVLLDAAAPFDNGRTLPAGLLREGPAALARADAVAISGRASDQEAAESSSAVGLFPTPGLDPEAIMRWTRPGTPLFHFAIEPTLLVGASEPDRRAGAIAEVRDSRWFAGMRVVAFAGIARPHRLADDLRRLGAEVVSFHPYPDHHVFTADDIRKILGAVDAFGFGASATTEKDLARLRGTPHLAALVGKGLLALRIEAVLPPPELAAFKEMIVRAARRSGGPGGPLSGESAR